MWNNEVLCNGVENFVLCRLKTKSYQLFEKVTFCVVNNDNVVMTTSYIFYITIVVCITYLYVIREQSKWAKFIVIPILRISKELTSFDVFFSVICFIFYTGARLSWEVLLKRSRGNKSKFLVELFAKVQNWKGYNAYN